MTGLMHEKEFSRKQFVKGGGALIVSFSLVGAGLARRSRAADSPYASNGPYDQFQIDSWIAINADNTVSLKSGAILQGTGSDTGLLMIAADELDIELGQISNVQSDTNTVPDSGNKSASNTITGAGAGVRAVAAAAREVLLGLAATQLGVPASQLSVSKGVVSGGGKSVSYGQLVGGKLFNVQLPPSYNLDPSRFRVGNVAGLNPGQASTKTPSQYKIVGTSPPRVDIPGIVAGTTVYIQNVRVPGMLHGRVVRPRGQYVYGFGAPIASVDASSIAHIPGARVVQKGNFLGIVAPREYDAIQAAAQLKVKWTDPPKALPGNGDEFAAMRALDAAGKSQPSYFENSGDVDRALTSAAHVVSRSFTWPTASHTPIGPNCAVADVTPNGAHIFIGTQGVYGTRSSVAPVIGLPLNKVRVTAFPMGSAFGPAQYNDTAQAAALMSQMVGAPVRVQLMRWDEIGWDQYGPGSLIDVRAGVDSKGSLVGFDVTQFYPQYRSGPETTDELQGTPVKGSSNQGTAAATLAYDVSNTNNRFLVKSLPIVGNWWKTAWMRAGSTPHLMFATEQVVDELAHLAGMDPAAFRMQNVNQVQFKGPMLSALDAVTKAANWQPRVSASKLSDETVVTGRGLAWNAYLIHGELTPVLPAMAAVADIEVNKKTGKITAKHIYQAVGHGLAISPGLIANQMVGGLVQVASRALVEELRYTETNVLSTDFVSYPILRFKDAPDITPIVVQQADLVSVGVGEPVSVLAGAAIANAFYDATGVRLQNAPMTPPRVRSALKAAGIT